jgi:hypothetical protein
VVLGVPFIGSRWRVITSSGFNIEMKGGESTGRSIEEGKRRRCERRFSSASQTRRRAADDSALGEATAIPSDQGGGKAPGWAERLSCWAGEGISTEKLSWAAKDFGPN